METQRLAEKIKEINMPDEMQERIIRRCYQTSNLEMENQTMKKRTNTFFRRTAAVAASLALCLCITGITALVASGQLKGFFKDIKNWQGAVVGTAYEQATDELEVAILDSSEELTVLVTMVNPKVAPYFTIQELGVENYEILDASGKVVVKGEPTAMEKVVDGQATIIVPAKELGTGTYKLVIHAFVGGAKAEQPLTMSGIWEVEFSR
ncbi:MAG: hypothetical protein IJ274_06040 [Lachnospiraceae bacterium]|nr:hypothetical protein [Lachnospiraceae bacterium]